MKQYKFVAVGGTFDHFHAGHQSLLQKAFSISEQVIIGITSDDFIRPKQLFRLIQSYDIRVKTVTDFLTSYFSPYRFQIIKLTDIYGSTLENDQIEALVVGPKTYVGAVAVNKKRESLGKKKLKIVRADFIKSADHQYLSSTRIRRGLINRYGDIYADLFKSDMKITPSFRKYLQDIHGKVIKTIRDFPSTIETENIVWVGDSVGEFFVKNKIKYTLGIFDLRTQRQPNPFFQSFLQKPKVDRIINKAGIIQHHLYKALQNAIQKQKQYLYVQGEEDLAVVPLILLLPLNSLIFYGLKNTGLIMLEVTEEKKEEVAKEIAKLLHG